MGNGWLPDFLEALADSRCTEEHDNYLVWVGYKFDPEEAFELGAANAALQHVR